MVYLFNPFPGAVLERVVADLESSLRERPRACAPVYVKPHAHAVVAASPLLERTTTIAERMPAAARGCASYERAAVFVIRDWPYATGDVPGASGSAPAR